MSISRGLGLAVLAAWAAASGCTTLREIPRDQYASAPERKSVRVETRDGLIYQFDYATFDADSLTGYRHRDVEGPFDELAVLRMPLDGVQRLTTRTVDWYRTTLVGGGALAGLIAAGLTQAHRGSADGGTSGGGGPRGPEPSQSSGTDR